MTGEREFVEVACRAGLLAAESAADLTRESDDRKIPPAQLAMQQGLLSPAQVEIVETLLNPQTAIAGYEILGLLGFGGMGVVYRARQKSLGRIVALKTVTLNAKTNPGRLSRFEQEAQTVGKLLHPHVITAYDFGRDGGRLFFAMELVEGEDVERRIERDGPFSESETWSLIRQAAAGLSQAAELGVVHRDIKPANLLLVTPPKGYPLPPGLPMVKIADFGLALITDEPDERTRLTADNSTVGSPHYMAPEQLGSAEVDWRADMYALGATAYHMLSGQPPFDGLTLAQLFAQKLNHEPTPLPELRPGLSLETIALVQQMLMREPTQRPESYAALIDRIDQLGLTSGSPATRAGTATWTAIPRPIVSTETRYGESETDPNLPPVAPPASLTNSFSRCALQHGLRVAAAVLAVIGIGAGIATWMKTPENVQPSASVELVPSGYEAELFDGQSVGGRWKISSGSWQVATDDEGAKVIAAGRGMISRGVGKEIPGEPFQRLEHYRLRFNLALRQASAMELSFGIQSLNSNAESWSVLRIEPDRVTLGRRTAKDAPLEPVVPPVTLALAPDKYHEVRIDRQAGEWRAYVDDRLIGTTRLSEHEAPQFRIGMESTADEAQAYLADFLVEELVTPETAGRK